MKYLNTLLVCFCVLLFSCSASKEVVATIEGKNIYLSEIFQNINETSFNKLNPEKKGAFVRKYAIHKILETKPKSGLEEIGLFIEDEKIRITQDIIVQEVEKYIIDKLVITDSILNFVENAANTDIYVKAITVPHAFSLGPPSTRTKEDARKRANKIYNRLLSGELSYDEALSIYSESPASKLKGNEMGQLKYGIMPKNFNDAVWNSPEGTLLKPLETPIGVHIVIVEKRIPKLGRTKIEFEQRKLKKQLIKGKYGFQEERFSIFIDTLYQEYDVVIDQDELHNLWDVVQKIEGVNSISGIPVSILKKVDYKNVIGRIGKKDITLEWCVNKTNDFSFYSNVTINKGFSFNKLISDVIARHLMVLWYEDNKKLFPGLEIKMREKIVNKIYSLFLDKMLEKNPELTQDIILNQFMVNEGLIIKNALFVEDSP